MKEWTGLGLYRYLEILAKNEVNQIARFLYIVAELDYNSESVPTGNAQVITYLEQLVEDHRGYFLMHTRTTNTLGELRWLAARVLACEYTYQGIETPIILEDVIQPIKNFDLSRVRLSIEELIQQGLLPTKTEIIKPQDYTYCCSKEAVEERIRNQHKNE